MFLTENNNPDNGFYSQLSQSSEYLGLRTYYRKLNNDFMRDIEIKSTLDVLTRTTRSNTIEDQITNQVVQGRYLIKSQELNCLDIQKNNSVICVGCGSFPETMIYFLEQTQASTVIGLDNDTSAAALANRLIHDLGYPQKYTQVLGKDGKDYNYSMSDIIHISGFVPNKPDVFRQILETAPKHVQITTEAFPRGLINLLYDDIENRLLHDDEFAHFQIVERIDSDYDYCSQRILKIIRHG